MRLFRLSVVLAFVCACGAAMSSPAMAQAPTRTPSTPTAPGALGPGVGCAFPVSIDLVAGDAGQNFVFFDQSGNVVRQMGTAAPSTWKITNLDTGASYTLKLPAGLLRVTTSADGTTTVVISGGAIGFNTPSDSPPGPFSFTNVGRLVAVIDANGHTTSLSLSGKRTDLCAAVAP